MNDAIITGLGDLGSGIGGALIGAASSSHAAGKQFKYNAWLQKQAASLNLHNAVKLSRHNAYNVPTMTRKGYEMAGLNPMLLVSNGTSGNNATFQGVGSSQVGMPDTAEAVTNGLSSGLANAQSFQRLKNETQVSEATADNQYSQADKNKIEKQSLLEKLPYISDKEKAEIGNIEKDSLLKESQIHNIDETTRFIEKNYELEKMLGLMGIDVQRQGIRSNLKGVIYNADTLKEIADKHSPSAQSASFENYTAGVRNILQGVGGVLHGSDVNYENYDESTTRTVKDKNETYTKTSRRKGKRKK